MERYNIPIQRPLQVSKLAKVPLETIQSARWRDALAKNHRSAVSMAAAVLLHAAVCAALLMMVRMPKVLKLASEQTVALVFAPSESALPEPAAPVAISDPPLPAETPAQPTVPVVAPSPPDPQPPPPATETKSSGAPQVTRIPVAHKPSAPVKSVAAPRIVLKQGAGQPHPSDAPLAPPASHVSVADAPIANAWQRSVATWLAAHKTYPDEARRQGTEGRVSLRFTVDRSGHVMEVTPVHSSGSPLLDAASEAMVRNARLPPFTAGMPQDTVTITVQIHYALTQ